MQINKISIIIIMVSVLIITSGTSILSSLVLAQTDLSNITLMNSSENQIQVASSGAELPQQEGPIPPTPERQPQGPIPPAPEEQPSEEPTIR